MVTKRSIKCVPHSDFFMIALYSNELIKANNFRIIPLAEIKRNRVEVRYRETERHT